MTPTDHAQIRNLLEHWARATRDNLQNDILSHHAADAIIYDVLPPLKYEGTAAYRRSWDDWQPDTQDESQFALQDLAIVAGSDVGFAHCFIQCGGVLANGESFSDLVRATFCLEKILGAWQVKHQHISKPFQTGSTN